MDLLTQGRSGNEEKTAGSKGPRGEKAEALEGAAEWRQHGEGAGR